MGEIQDFGWALWQLRDGLKACRTGWNGKGMHIELVDTDGEMFKDGKSLPYLMMKTAQGDYFPWLASQADILADDWEVTT